MERPRIRVMMAVSRVRHAWQDHVRDVAREIGIPDSYREIISYLSRNPGASQRMVAEFCSITTAAVNQTVKEMVADGYVKKETDANDRRCTRLFLTEKGEETGRKVRKMLHNSDEIIAAAITPEKEAEMIELLDKIYDCIRKELK